MQVALGGNKQHTFNECKQQLKPLLLIKVKTVVEKSKCIITDKLKCYFVTKIILTSKKNCFLIFPADLQIPITFSYLNYDF